MSDKYDDEIIQEEDHDQEEEHGHGPEKFCTLCRRSERQAGRMIDLPNNIHICSDCMQKSRNRFLTSKRFRPPIRSRLPLTNM